MLDAVRNAGSVRRWLAVSAEGGDELYRGLLAHAGVTGQVVATSPHEGVGGSLLLVLDHNYILRVAIVGGLVVTAGPVELKVWEISVSYKLRPSRRVSVRFHRKGWVG